MDIPEDPRALVVGHEFSDGKGGRFRIVKVEGEVEIVPGVIGPRSITVEGVMTTPQRKEQK